MIMQGGTWNSYNFFAAWHVAFKVKLVLPRAFKISALNTLHFPALHRVNFRDTSRLVAPPVSAGGGHSGEVGVGRGCHDLGRDGVA